MSSVPRVSVGMPVYNSERWLPGTIDSVLAQTFSDLELIISDNASTDGTEALCRDYMKRDPRVRYFRNPKNIGVLNNFNACFKHARAPFFRWHAAADLCEPRLVERCYETLLAHPDAVIAYPRTALFENETNDGKEYGCNLNAIQETPSERFLHVLQWFGLNNAQSGLMRGDVIRRTNLIPNHLDGDTIFMMELSLYGKFVKVPEILFYRRMKAETASTLNSRDWIVRYIDPDMRSPHYQNWKTHRSRFSAVHRAPIPASEKWKIYRELFRRFRWSRGELMADIKNAFRGKPA